MTWLWLGYTGLIFIPGIYYIYTVCILFRMRYAEYILKLKNLYIFYTTYILPGLVDVLGIYLRYDNIGDIFLQNGTTLVYDYVCRIMRCAFEEHGHRLQERLVNSGWLRNMGSHVLPKGLRNTGAAKWPDAGSWLMAELECHRTIKPPRRRGAGTVTQSAAGRGYQVGLGKMRLFWEK